MPLHGHCIINWITKDGWFIEARLLPSQNWGTEIIKGVETADVIIVLLSKNSYVQEETDYPTLSFVFDFLQAMQNEKLSVIPLLLDDSELPMDFNAWRSINYFPKNQRKLNYQKILASLKAYAGELGLSFDKQLPQPTPEKSMQWMPSLWKQLDAESFEKEADGKSPDSFSVRLRQRLRKNIFGRVNNLFIWGAAVNTLLVISICGLTINAVVRGENTNSFTAPIISRALTLIPLPTPTLGVGSVRISSKDGMRMV